MSDTWAVVTAALGAAFLTGITTFGLELWRERWSEKRARKERLREACAQLNTHALAFLLHAPAITRSALYLSAPGDALAEALYRGTLPDAMELIDRLVIDYRPMIAAQAVIQVLGDDKLIRGGAEVIRAVNDLTSKLTNFAEAVGRQAAKAQESRDTFQDGFRELMQEIYRFARLTRKGLGVNDPDAIIRAYPEVFAEPAPQPASETTRQAQPEQNAM